MFLMCSKKSVSLRSSTFVLGFCFIHRHDTSGVDEIPFDE